VGDRILLSNGMLTFEVLSLTPTDARLPGGQRAASCPNRKSMSFPNKVLSGPYMSEPRQIRPALRHPRTTSTSSPARSSPAVRTCSTSRRSCGRITPRDIELIAKIENRAGIENIEEICEECDGIMVAPRRHGRRDPVREVPAVQKQLITKCRLLGKRVITATEMLESMIHNPRPTRAEIERRRQRRLRRHAPPSCSPARPRRANTPS
jgi:pyruvate kinase